MHMECKMVFFTLFKVLHSEMTPIECSFTKQNRYQNGEKRELKLNTEWAERVTKNDARESRGERERIQENENV